MRVRERETGVGRTREESEQTTERQGDSERYTERTACFSEKFCGIFGTCSEGRGAFSTAVVRAEPLRCHRRGALLSIFVSFGMGSPSSSSLCIPLGCLAIKDVTLFLKISRARTREKCKSASTCVG